VIESLNIPKPDDFHVHLRQGSLLKLVIPFTAAHFSRALVMPNTEPPILTARDAVNYAAELRSASPQGMNVQPLTTIKRTKSARSVSVENAAAAGVLAAKFYPQGMTTNAWDGPVNLHDLQPGVLDAMQESDLVLCVHGEAAGYSVWTARSPFCQNWMSTCECFHVFASYWSICQHGRLLKQSRVGRLMSPRPSLPIISC